MPQAGVLTSWDTSYSVKVQIFFIITHSLYCLIHYCGNIKQGMVYIVVGRSMSRGSASQLKIEDNSAVKEQVIAVIDSGKGKG